MRPVIGFYIFGASLQNFVQSTKSKETYTTVRFSFRKDTLLAGPRVRPVVGFYSFGKMPVYMREVLQERSQLAAYLAAYLAGRG